ncbi:MAG: hypothetical protein IIW49_06485 [Treponema sp.]|nr:hypothetical protein [Treponema sp.]
MKKIIILIYLLLFNTFVFAKDLDLYGIELNKTNVLEATKILIDNNYELTGIKNDLTIFTHKSDITKTITIWSQNNKITKYQFGILTDNTISNVIMEIFDYFYPIDNNIKYTEDGALISFSTENSKYIAGYTQNYMFNKNFIQIIKDKDGFGTLQSLESFKIGTKKQDLLTQLKTEFPDAIIEDLKNDTLKVFNINYNNHNIISTFKFDNDLLRMIVFYYENIEKEIFYKKINYLIEENNLKFDSVLEEGLIKFVAPDRNYLIYTYEIEDYGSSICIMNFN